MSQRIWNLPDANAALPQVRLILSDARGALARARDAEAQMEDLKILWGEQVHAVACPDHVEFNEWHGKFLAARNEHEAHVLRFAALGCDVKDVIEGLIDFRGRVGEREVWLCWRDGEDTIRFWHALDTGFRNRQSIPGAT